MRASSEGNKLSDNFISCTVQTNTVRQTAQNSVSILMIAIHGIIGCSSMHLEFETVNSPVACLSGKLLAINKIIISMNGCL